MSRPTYLWPCVSWIVSSLGLLACSGGTGDGEVGRGDDMLTSRATHPHPAPDAGVGDAGAPSMALPQAALTPGAVLTNDLHKICQPGYPSTVRNVTAQEKAAVAAAYHYTGPSSGVEYDHLISLELGGSNDPTNLWPEPIAEAHIKDRLEGYLHEHVCRGDMPLADAQTRIASNWIQLWIDVGRP